MRAGAATIKTDLFPPEWRRILNAIEDTETREARRVSLRRLAFHAQKRYAVRARRHLPPKVLEAMARTKYTTLVEVDDYVDVEEMRAYLAPNGDQVTETTTQERENSAYRSAR